jgi:hypothetical protein
MKSRTSFLSALVLGSTAVLGGAGVVAAAGDRWRRGLLHLPSPDDVRGHALRDELLGHRALPEHPRRRANGDGRPRL